jgi:hypothetical protein
MLESSEAGFGPFMLKRLTPSTDIALAMASPKKNSRASCGRSTRHHNIPRWIGTPFAMMVSSFDRVFAPMLLGRFMRGRVNAIDFVAVKQLVLATSSLLRWFM